MIAAKELDSYYQEVRNHLLCSKAKQDDFIFLAKFRVSELQQENPDLTYEEVIEFLGEPQELAQTYMDSLDDAVVEHYKKKRTLHRFIRFLCTGLIISILMISLIGVYHHRENVTFRESTDIFVVGDD